MEYSEEYTWNLTSSTTCYSGVQRLQDQDEAAPAIRFAVGWHTCSLQLVDEEAPVLNSREITNQENDSLVCVGYSSTAEWECLALLDISKLPTDNPDSAEPSHQESPSIAREVAVVEEQSVSSAEATRTRSSQTLPSVDDATSTSPLRPDVALLILRHLQTQEEYVVTLDFRPLAPTVCQLTASETGIFLGSPDNHKLRWFRPCKTTTTTTATSTTTGALEARPLPSHPAFQFASPVMATEFFDSRDDVNDDNHNYISWPPGGGLSRRYHSYHSVGYR